MLGALPRGAAMKADSRSGGTSSDSTPAPCGQVEPNSHSALGQPVLPGLLPERRLVGDHDLGRERLALRAQRPQPARR